MRKFSIIIDGSEIEKYYSAPDVQNQIDNIVMDLMGDIRALLTIRETFDKDPKRCAVYGNYIEVKVIES